MPDGLSIVLWICSPPAVERSVEPGAGRGAYDDLYARYGETYRALRATR